MVDSDPNDPNYAGRISNSSPNVAQQAENPMSIVGYVNVALAGPPGANFSTGDRWDFYAVDLVAGQVVELNFGDATTRDIDLFLTDLQGNILGQSTGVTRSECVRVTRTARYYVGVYAFSGASTYELAWAPPAGTRTCANSALSVEGAMAAVPGQFVAKAKQDAPLAQRTRAQSVLRNAGIALKSAPLGEAQPMLLEMPPTSIGRTRAMASLGEVTTAGGKAIAHEAPAGMGEAGVAMFQTIVAAKMLRSTGAYEYVDLNEYDHAQQATFGAWPPNDTNLGRMPHLGLIRLPDAFNALNSFSPRPSYTPIVAVVDSGIVADHPDLARMLVPGYDFVADPTNAGDGGGIDPDANEANGPSGRTNFHGTHVAGTVAAETFNGQGMVGVAPMARIMPIRVLGVTGSGTAWDIAQGIRFAARLQNDSGTLPARRADVINLSLGGQGACPAVYLDAISAARAQGSIVVAAAGNDNGAPVARPANCPGAIAVGAISYDGRRATYSNIGLQLAVAAPGGDASRLSPAGQDMIFSASASFVRTDAGATIRVPTYIGSPGTSMAAPHVSGVFALMRAVNPNLTPADIDSLLPSGSLTTDIGTPGRDTSFGFGLIDAMKAVQAAAATTGGAITVLPTMELSPPVLDFGTALTELQIVIRRVNGSADAPISFASSATNQGVIQILTPPGGNPASGPFVYNVVLNRSLLLPGETIIRVEIVTQQNRRLPFDISITPPPSTRDIPHRGMGPVYVIAVNVDTLANAGQFDSRASTAHPYSISGITAPRVAVVAGSDLDNDGSICGPSEPCGLYPLLGVDPTVLTMDSNKTGIDFALLNLGTSAASVGASSPLRPAAGYLRRRSH